MALIIRPSIAFVPGSGPMSQNLHRFARERRRARWGDAAAAVPL